MATGAGSYRGARCLEARLGRGVEASGSKSVSASSLSATLGSISSLIGWLLAGLGATGGGGTVAPLP